ncbi:hypothetical protein PCANC_11076 [Puccinia coronata f. sp. avenae]|uniref:Uncharacterized protein n=1 Tax=Puccinia coronata f. sp. avenae TaxID=200324 RepID=A0A2N5UW41_9BASI|nr:hypothetical protein PCANC_11076 [Puccinia coronata f. sp. avenae]
MSEVLVGEPSLAQIHGNIRLAESLASQSGSDVTPERQEEILQLLRNRLNLMNRAVQLGLLERYVRICRKSSTSYPPFPITGIKTCLYIIKVATDTSDLSIKEKLAIVIENWRIILEQEIDPVLAGPQPVWTCKALCQLTGRGPTTPDPPIPNSTKRKRSQDNANEAHDTFIPKSSPQPQICRASSSRISEDAVLQDSPRHLTPSTLNTANGTTQERAICPNSAPPEFNKPASVETHLHHKLELLKSSSCDPVNKVKTPSVLTSSSTITNQTPITPTTSRLLLSPSTESSSALQQTTVITPPCNTPSSNVVDHKACLPPESFKSQSSIPSQSQTSRVAPQNYQLIKASTLTFNNPAVECNHETHAVIVSSAPSISPVISAQVHSWQNAFCLLDSAVTELLEIMPLTPVVPLSTASFKPNPYSPSFQWVPRSAYAYTDPPGLSLTNISPILTFQPQLETHPPPTRPFSVTNPTPSGSNHLASSEKDSEKKMLIASSSSPVTRDISVARHKLPSHASLQGPLLPPAESCARAEPTPSRPLTSSNQVSSVQPSPQQANQITENAIPDFDVTEAQKKKFVDTYRHVDAHGKAKLEATLRKSNLWHVFAPLLSTSAAPGTLSTSTPQTVSLAPERNASAALIHPNLATTPQLSSSPEKSNPVSIVDKSMNVPTVVSLQQSVARLPNSEPSEPMSNSVTSQPAKASFNPISIQSAKLCKEGSLDPILSRMISAMLVAEPQPTSLIMTALESFDIRNQEVIITHLKALAIPIHHDKVTFWQLRTQAKPASPSTTSLIDPSFFASHYNSTHKPADLMTASNQKTELAPPQPSYSLHNGAAEKCASDPQDQHVISEQLNSTSQPQVKPAKPQETLTQSSSQIDAVGEVPGDEKEVIEITDLEAKKVTFVRDLEGGIDTPVGEMESTQVATIGRGGDTGSDERPSNTKRSPRRLRASLITTRQSRRPSPSGIAKTPQEKLSFNILYDGLPGFPDADPSIQIPGAPARILARYPPDQQMPPIRTFVPLLKKSRS